MYDNYALFFIMKLWFKHNYTNYIHIYMQINELKYAKNAIFHSEINNVEFY